MYQFTAGGGGGGQPPQNNHKRPAAQHSPGNSRPNYKRQKNGQGQWGIPPSMAGEEWGWRYIRTDNWMGPLPPASFEVAQSSTGIPCRYVVPSTRDTPNIGMLGPGELHANLVRAVEWAELLSSACQPYVFQQGVEWNANWNGDNIQPGHIIETPEVKTDTNRRGIIKDATVCTTTPHAFVYTGPHPCVVTGKHTNQQNHEMFEVAWAGTYGGKALEMAKELAKSDPEAYGILIANGRPVPPWVPPDMEVFRISDDSLRKYWGSFKNGETLVDLRKIGLVPCSAGIIMRGEIMDFERERIAQKLRTTREKMLKPLETQRFNNCREEDIPKSKESTCQCECHATGKNCGVSSAVSRLAGTLEGSKLDRAAEKATPGGQDHIGEQAERNAKVETGQSARM